MYILFVLFKNSWRTLEMLKGYRQTSFVQFSKRRVYSLLLYSKQPQNLSASQKQTFLCLTPRCAGHLGSSAPDCAGSGSGQLHLSFTCQASNPWDGWFSWWMAVLEGWVDIKCLSSPGLHLQQSLWPAHSHVQCQCWGKQNLPAPLGILQCHTAKENDIFF